jgi:sRNA-binding protein
MRQKAREDAKMAQVNNEQMAAMQQSKIAAESQKEAQKINLELERDLRLLKGEQENIVVGESAKRETVIVKGDIDKEILELANKLKIEAEAAGVGYDSTKSTMPKTMGGEPDININP